MAHHQFYTDIKKFPNLLCLYRIVVIIICVVFFLFDYPIVGSTLGLTAGLTDYWDGIYARKHNMVTRLGALLDQVTDLMFNFFVFAAAAYVGVWPIALLFLWGFRDLAVLSMRASAAQLGFDIPSIYLGKLASAVIFYSLFLMPITYALTSHDTEHVYLYSAHHSVYQFAPWVQENIPWWVGFGLYWIAMTGVVVGIVLQWITAYKYARVYINKYDEFHRVEADKQKNGSDGKSAAPQAGNSASNENEKQTAEQNGDNTGDQSDKNTASEKTST